MKRLLVFLLPLLSLIACQEAINPDGCEELVRSNRKYDNAQSDDFQLVEASIEDDCLKITVRYGGGCGEVDFDLIAQEGETLSLPPQVQMRLVLDDDDNCEALLTDELFFDVSSLKSGVGTGVHMLTLEGLTDMIEYRY